MLYLLTLLIACDPDKENQEDSSFPTSSHVDPSSLSNTNCQDFEGTPVAGAAVYFSGTFGLDGDTVRGVEAVYFVANETWQETGQDDCQIMLNVSGNLTDGGNCSICDVGLALSATIDEANSNCPEGLQVDYEALIENYASQGRPLATLGRVLGNQQFRGNRCAVGVTGT